jgi:ABC-type amino acid transport substrate-binding protein
MLKSTLKRINFFNLLVFTCLSLPICAKELLMLTDDGPPHMIAASNNGIDVDIAREVLEIMEYSVKLDFAPLNRTMLQVANKQADLFLPTFSQKDTEKLFISAPIINYRPTAFSLENNKFQFTKIADLAGKRVVTFQGAKGYFGEEFVKISKFNGYSELHDMSKFPEMLLKERCDVVVLDYYIFYYYLQEYLKLNPANSSTNKEIDEFLLFPIVQAHVGFNDEALRNKFNQQLQLYKNQERDKKVIKKYINSIELSQNSFYTN